MTETVLLINSALELVGPLTPTKLQTTRKYAGVSSMSMTLARRVLYGEQVLTGSFLYLPDGNEIYQVELVETVASGSPANTGLTVSGRSIEGFALDERRVIPPTGESHDVFSGAAESAIKHYVNAHAAADAAAERQLPNFVVAADAATGISVDVAGRYQTVGKVLDEIAAVSGMGWAVTYDPDTHEFVFDTIAGRDLSDVVFFDFDFQTLEQWVEVRSIVDSKTFAIVAGQGEGADRDIVYRWGPLSEPTGFDRRETFIDARDVELGSTALLDQRGDAAIAALSPERSLEARVHPYGSFKYRRDWLEGDTVLVRDEASDVLFTARVAEVTRTWDDTLVAPKIDVVLDRAIPTIKDRVTESAGTSGTIVDKGTGGGSGTIDYAEDADISTQAFGDSPAAGASVTEVAGANHKHGMPANPVTAHEAAGDPHTGYRLESADHSHASTGLQGGQVAHSALSGISATDHHVAAAAGPDADVTIDAAGAAGTASTFARSGHGHKVSTSSATPAASTVAGTAGTSGTAPSRGDHAHPAATPTINVYTTGSGNWSKPAGCRWVRVRVVGGGGGGGGAASTGSGTRAAASGGGGGGYAEKVFAASALGSTEAYAVGSGGTAGTAGNNNGNAGNTSSFSSAGNLVQATGGGAGTGSAAATNGAIPGGAGGVGSGGDLNVKGSGATTAVIAGATSGSFAQGSNGGDSALGGGAVAVDVNTAGNAGGAYGGGGGGGVVGVNNATARAGGNGADGVVIVESIF